MKEDNSMDIKTAIAEDLCISVGTGVTKHNGRDSYPFYVSEVLPNGVVGLTSGHGHFDSSHPWEGGIGVVDPFDHDQPTEFYIKRRYGNWWKVHKNGKPISRFTDRYSRICFGRASFYQDPSF